jgi:CDP-glucose 4,6-dehydratase
MHFLITGHTGFKGSWLVALLKARGHTVSGYSDGFLHGSLYDVANLRRLLSLEEFADICDTSRLSSFINSVKPNFIIHFAAQSIVRESYRHPELTFEVNSEGTNSLMRAVKAFDGNLITLVVTTDKVYKDLGANRPYVETDPLQGSEPYGQSKAIADLSAQYWMQNHLLSRMAIARAGNVIGGGDNNSERLMPELISKYMSGGSPDLRYPDAIRPWQHVLDCLNGYIFIVDNLSQGGASDIWNIGPDVSSHVSVKEIQELTSAFFDQPSTSVSLTPVDLSESTYLALNSEKIRARLGWSNHLNLKESVFHAVNWHIEVGRGRNPFDVTMKQIESFLEKTQ